MKYEIQKVANGFIIQPSWSPNSSRNMATENDIFVFETFESMVKFLKDHLEAETS